MRLQISYSPHAVVTFFGLLALLGILLSQEPAYCEGEQGSIGLQVVPIATGELVVLSVIPGSPADQERLLPGDLIVQVDGTPLLGSDFQQVVRTKLWGEVGTRVEIEFMRPGKVGLHRKILTRAALLQSGAKLPQVQMLLPDKECPKE